MSRDLIELILHLHRTTDRAYLVSDDGEDDSAVWVPKSLVQVEEERVRPVEPGGNYTFLIPEWMAQEKGLI